MRDITLELLKIIVMIASCLIARYLIPWLKAGIDADKEARVKEIISDAVYMAQQLYWAKTGEERKEKAIEYAKKILASKGINVSAEELNTILEAAVKQLKISEGR
ncbi:MAG: phage holin [Butyrivibrio sp.]|nr:phage holin [Butyrivibrio sp.]